jgi:uncharacterized membrane protein
MGKMIIRRRPQSKQTQSAPRVQTPQRAQLARESASALDAKEPIGMRVFGRVVGVYVIFCLMLYAILVMTGLAFSGAVPLMIVFFGVAYLIDLADSRRRR